MNQTTLADMWKVVSKNADQKDSFGFSSIPMKNWDMAKGTCKESFVLATQKDAGISLQIQNLKVDGKAVSDKDPLAKLFLCRKWKEQHQPRIYLSGSGPSGKI